MNAKNKKILIIAGAVLAVLVVAFVLISVLNKPETTEGDKTITVVVVHKDGTEKEFTVNTNQEFLGRAVVEAGIVEDNQSAYGLYALNVDGYTVDEAAQEWWMFCKDGESLMTGADETPIADGEHYEIVLTVGF